MPSRSVKASQPTNRHDSNGSYSNQDWKHAREGERSKTQKNEAKKCLSSAALVRITEVRRVRLFHTPEHAPFAVFFAKDHWENWPVKSPTFTEWLCAMCFHDYGMVPSQKAVSEALNTLAGRALFDSPEKKVHVRVAGNNDAIYLDLGNSSWEVVKITRDGWEVASQSPVMFFRVPGMLPLPHPIRGGKIDDLRRFLNFDGDDQWKLAVSWLIAAFRPTGPYVVLILEGNHGCAKSTSARVLHALIDPNEAPLRGEPTNPRDLAISAKNSWCLMFDNLSSVRGWLPDALCRLSTGGGFSTRALYTDDAEKIFDGMRPVLLNGINIGIDQADLLDRAIVLSLPPISEENRETEAEFWAKFESIWPYLLGSLLDGVACALRRLREVKLSRRPRMADFATWVCAAEPAFGWPGGSFLDAYRRNRSETNSLALGASPLVQPLLRIAARGVWQGTPTELLIALSEESLNGPIEEAGSFPRSPRELSQAIRRLVPNLLQVGITVEFGRTTGDNSQRTISIKLTCGEAMAAARPDSGK
jgi:hypothetical protein